MKKSVLALSIAAMLVAPSIQAVELGGSVRYGLVHNTKDDGDSSLQNRGSRLKGSGDIDLGNGLTGLGSFELRLADERNGEVVNRKYSIGVKGDFGSFEMGVRDTAYDLSTSDGTYWNGAFGLLGNRIEKNGAFVYKKSAGDVTFAIGGQMDPDDTDNDALDLVDAAVKYKANGLTLAAGVQSLADDGVATNLTAGYDFSGWKARITLGTEDEDYTGGAEKTALNIQAFAGDAYAWYGLIDTDEGGPEATRVGLGYVLKLGPKTLIWTEVFSQDPDDGTDTFSAVNVILKRDF